MTKAELLAHIADAPDGAEVCLIRWKGDGILRSVAEVEVFQDQATKDWNITLRPFGHEDDEVE